MLRHLICLGVFLFATPVLAHEIYSHWTDPVTGLGCCNDRDCKPYPAENVKETRVNGVFGYMLATGEFWPASRTIPSPDGNYHRCTYEWDVNNPDLNLHAKRGETRCFSAPMGQS